MDPPSTSGQQNSLTPSRNTSFLQPLADGKRFSIWGINNRIHAYDNPAFEAGTGTLMATAPGGLGAGYTDAHITMAPEDVSLVDVSCPGGACTRSSVAALARAGLA